ncbi:pectate lyase family protein [Sphingobacterium corticibacterium]|uniref:Pectate lyase n=1 Tax=Sphingobacterium corticibacterium TaxID=2484746 RepID=A0A4Q6XTA6_9SPHI|nr:hypothetical protein [Sphingobacterium corticibacterium]RZF59807.1 hypothetical protein EWE74_11705 [Sphingobacterium corticibacterium]
MRRYLNLISGLFVGVLFTLSTVLQAQSLLSFPGAEGFGRFAKGARGHEETRVYFVTTLADDGPGSFRDAVSQPGRFVIFRVAGIIRLKDNITIAPYTTIAGHTAPGDGIVLYGRKVSFSGANETIARFLRIRLGANAGAGKNEDASGIANGKNIILDHMSFSWGLDEVFSVSWDKKGVEPDSITLQNCIIAQGLHRYNHSAGGLMQTGGKLSILKSLYISNKTRNPKVKGTSEFVNNVVYNFGNANKTKNEHQVSADAYILGGGSAMISNALILHNYFIGGPATPKNKQSPFSRGNENFNLYQTGNYYDNNQNGVLDGVLIDANEQWYPGLALRNFKTIADYANYPSISPALQAQEVISHLVSQVGATRPKRDQVDALLIRELSSKGTSGLYVYDESDLPLSNGGLGDIADAPALIDTDDDGIPDEWEIRLGLDKNKTTDALQLSIDPKYRGYLNIEVYLHRLAEE